MPLRVANASNDAGAAAVLLVLADWDGTVYRLPRALLTPYRVASDAPMAAGPPEPVASQDRRGRRSAAQARG